MESRLIASSLTFSPICENVFHTSTHFWPHEPLHFTFSHKLNVRVAMLWILNPIFLVHCHSYLDKYWLELFDFTKKNHGFVVVV
jgi:hypothetical protein